MKALKSIFVVLFTIILLSTSALAVTALWDHSPTATVIKYRIAWGTVVGTYPLSQDMLKSACVPGNDTDAGPYDCKMIVTGTFVDNATYHFIGYAINYDLEGKEQLSVATPDVVFVKRPTGTVGSKPEPMQGLGIYDK